MDTLESTAGTMKSVTMRDRLWLWLCAISFGCYLWYADAVPAFFREVSRLLDKL